MSPNFAVDAKRSLVAGILLLSSFVLPAAAQSPKPIFEQDLEPFGLQLKELSKDLYTPDLSTLAFLSDDLLLVAIHEPGACRPFRCAPGTASSEASLLLFSLSENKLIRQTHKPIALLYSSIQPTQNEHFLLPDGTGIELCSAEFLCSDTLPISGPMAVSPQGTRAVITDPKTHGQALIDTATLSVLKVFGPNDPFVLPGDNGLLLVRGKKVSLALAGEQERELDYEEEFDPKDARRMWTQVYARFLNDHEVMGYTEIPPHGFVDPRRNLRVEALDGKLLALLPDWRDFAASASGSRVWVHESGEPGLNLLGRISEKHLHDFVNVQVFDTDSGRRVFNLEWNPEPFVRTGAISPALSPAGRRLALVRKGVLQVYDIP
jgi:hypothetical protein